MFVHPDTLCALFLFFFFLIFWRYSLFHHYPIINKTKWCCITSQHPPPLMLMEAWQYLIEEKLRAFFAVTSRWPEFVPCLCSAQSWQPWYQSLLHLCLGSVTALLFYVAYRLRGCSQQSFLAASVAQPGIFWNNHNQKMHNKKNYNFEVNMRWVGIYTQGYFRINSILWHLKKSTA